MKSFDLHTYLDDHRALVNKALNAHMDQYSNDSRIVQAMRHSVFAGGKRLRPILCIAAAKAVGGDAMDVLDLGCALEMIHTYSLIHDDLPALDNDDYRRGHLTCHKAFDEATAILAGDALLTNAFEILTNPLKKNSFEKSMGVANKISRAAGANGMIDGQMRDMQGETRPYTLAELENMHHKKTGALIRVSVFAGAFLSNATKDQINALEKYAINTGLAFQVADDILNVEGDPELLGKAVGTDKSRHKSTYPALLGIDSARDFAKELINKALQAVSSFDNKCDPLRAIASYVILRQS